MSLQLRTDVEKLAAPGSRKVGSPGHLEALDYLKGRMGTEGLAPYRGGGYELPYQVEGTWYTNLAGVWPGEHRALDPILLVAHYDTCGDQPGADDNAAAIAICFQALNSLKTLKLQRDVIFLFPDAEEPPRFLTDHMGSTYFYKHQLQGSLHAGLVLDLVGHDVPIEGMEELLFIFGAESHQQWSGLLQETTLPPGLKNIATLNRYVGDLSDHHVLREHGNAYLFLTCGRWEHYHQESDLPQHLNYEKMGRICEYLVSLVERMDAQPFGPRIPDYDPVDMELFLIHRAVGNYLETNEIPMQTRDDIQKFVLSWVGQNGL